MAEITTNNNDIALGYKSKKEVAKGGLLGFFIGIAVIVPGISGATIAILLKLYDKLLYAIGNIFGKFRKCFVFLLPIDRNSSRLFARIPYDTANFRFSALYRDRALRGYDRRFPAVGAEIKSEKATPARTALFRAGSLSPSRLPLYLISLPKAAGALKIFRFSITLHSFLSVPSSLLHR